MSYSRVNKPDTAADIQLRDCLIRKEKQNFLMISGAGSGKTTSLIKALSTIISVHGKNLKKHRQRIACITYTEIASAEIWADVGNNPLVHVSTIHSFLWSIVRSFQADIHKWVLRRIDARIADLGAEAAAFGPRVQQRTRDKNQRDIHRYASIKEHTLSHRIFTYGTGSDYPNGVLGHDDIIRIATEFLDESSLFRTLLAQQFPFVFVDESQDTQQAVVQAFKATASEAGNAFCLGFFGDPMQRIYMTGIGEIPKEDSWLSIDKKENFRCPVAVLSVANAVRRGGDKLEQTSGRVNVDGTPPLGTARMFILPADQHRDDYIAAVRTFVSQKNHDPAWSEGSQGDIKILVIVHRMAATRLGFANLYSAMNDKAPGSFADGFLDGTSWPLRPFERFIMPIIEAKDAGDEFEVISILRKNSPLLYTDNLRGVNVAVILAQIRRATERLAEMAASNSIATVRDALTLVRDEQLWNLDPRLLDYLEDSKLYQQRRLKGSENDDESSKEIASMDAFLTCPVSEFRGYRRYLSQQSPFSTQQGIKGSEFERVLVILDDDEGTHVQFSYDKLFGVKELSPRDLENLAEGKDTTIDRTRRLFYVCCTRALTDLVVIYFSSDPELAEQKVRETGYFPHTDIFNKHNLT